MYINAYSEDMAYSGLSRTGDIFSQFRAHYSGVTQEQFINNFEPYLERPRHI